MVGWTMPLTAAWTLIVIAMLLLPGSAPAAPATLSPAQQWALATSALLTARNRERHDVLGGVEPSPGAAGKARQLLDEWWDTRDRAGLLRSLQWIENGGHRMQFAQLGRELTAHPSAEVEALQTDPRIADDVRRKIAVVVREYDRLGAKGLLGWDYARYVSLCRWGYVAGYLSEDEAWLRIMKAARLLQQTFGSWRELGQNYLIGRAFWSPIETDRNGQLYEATFQRLVSEPQSPWVRLPWRTRLEER